MLQQKKRIQKMNTVVLLKKWLESASGSKIELAQHFHFSTTGAIDQWIARNAIPKKKESVVLEFLKGKTSGTTRKGNKR